MQLGFGKGILIIGKQVTEKKPIASGCCSRGRRRSHGFRHRTGAGKDRAYPDTVVRAALDTLSVRATVPDAEQLSLLPFTVGDFAGFHIDNVLPGRALMLIDAPNSTSKDDRKARPSTILDARLLIAAVPGGPTRSDDHANFARLAFNDIGGIKDVQITMSEPVRIGGQQGFQTWPSQGHAHRHQGHGGAVAALRRRRIPANGRHFARRYLGRRVVAHAHHARQRRIEVIGGLE